MRNASTPLLVLTLVIAVITTAASTLQASQPRGLGVSEEIPENLPWYFVAVFGDNRPADTSSTEFPEPFKEILAEIAAAKPFAVIGTGDHTGEGRRGQIDVFIEAVANLPNVWVAVGNHDYWGDRDYWVERVAPLQYYRDDIPGWRIVFLNSEAPLNTIVEYARDSLSVERHKIVVIHRPLEPFVDHNLYFPTRVKLEEVIVGAGVELVVQGHWHGYAETMVNGTHYVIVGGGGAPLYSHGDYPSVYSYAYLLLFPNGTYMLIPLSLEGEVSVEMGGETIIIRNTKLDVYGNPAPVPLRLEVETSQGMVNIVLLAQPGTTVVKLGEGPGGVEANTTLIYTYVSKTGQPTDTSGTTTTTLIPTTTTREPETSTTMLTTTTTSTTPSTSSIADTTTASGQGGTTAAALAFAALAAIVVALLLLRRR